MTQREQIARGAEKLGLSPDSLALDRLTEYLSLLAEANRLMNLTAVPAAQWPVRHILDSLSIANFVRGESIADIGTGAGLPGIPLAILAGSDCRWTLIDKSEKKCGFLIRTKHKLQLQNVRVMHHRATAAPVPATADIDTNDTNKPNNRPAVFDCVVARALGDAELLRAMVGPLLVAGGRLFYMRGRDDNPAELSAGDSYWHAPTRHRLRVPFLEAQRHLDIWQKRLI